MRLFTNKIKNNILLQASSFNSTLEIREFLINEYNMKDKYINKARVIQMKI